MQEIDPEFFPGLRAQPWWEVDEIDNKEWVDLVVAGLPYVWDLVKLRQFI
ncbi:unnamed protein product [Symbiodinium natans]|uniref:Uncharacterized protein n=1 Tax=Symbiodinium natans TaxID=878477 RepID=A0A812TP56_9DINO|nr:unnamed protein product [Symbiodinium natans]